MFSFCTLMSHIDICPSVTAGSWLGSRFRGEKPVSYYLMRGLPVHGYADSGQPRCCMAWSNFWLEVRVGDTDYADYDVECSKQLYALLLDLKPLLIVSANYNDELERLKPVLRYIAEHLDRSLSLKELAAVAVVSPQYLCRLFQKALHTRPVFYVNQERINRSKQLMFSERELRIYEVADRVGYENASYFCAMFKRHTGMSPERFRKLHGLS